MKRNWILFSIGFFFLLSLNAQAAVVFSEDFESGLSGWTGKGGGIHHGQTVTDPLNPANKALNFTALNSAGDIFTSAAAFSAGTYSFSFDYLGSATNPDSGGYFGISTGFPGPHTWLWATGSASGATDVLIDDGQWHSYTFIYTAGYDFHLMLEDFSGSGGVAGDAYFDNIRIDNLQPVPEPATLILLGTGLLGLIGVRRRR